MWTHTTAMALAVAEMASLAGNLIAPQRLDDLVARWAWWARTAKNVGPQTAAVLAAFTEDTETDTQAFRDTAAALYADTGRTLDATCLTRAVPVALANLDPKDERPAAHTARKLCELTHAGPDAAEATVLYTLAVRHAVLTGELDLRIGLPHIDEDRQELWETRIAQAEASRPADFTDATYKVEAHRALLSVAGASRRSAAWNSSVGSASGSTAHTSVSAWSTSMPGGLREEADADPGGLPA